MHNNVGDVLVAQGDLRSALESYQPRSPLWSFW